VLLSVVKPILVPERRVPLGILEPDLPQSVVNCAGDDVHVRERAAEVCDAAAASHEERDEDDVCRIHAVVEENADGHESSRACADLRQDKVHIHEVRAPLGRAEVRAKKTCLCIEEKDPCVYRAMSFADAIG